MRKFFAAFLLTGASLIAVQAQAEVITVLVNTGTDAGGVDANWKLNGGDAYSTTNAEGWPIGGGVWTSNDATSSWITPTANQSDSLDPVVNGNYTYSLDFDMSAYHANSASFVGRFLVDNKVSSISLNGNSLFSGLTGGFQSNDWVQFGANSGFLAGMNTLEFTAVNSALGSGNPAGLRVEFLQSSAYAVPEPATWALMIMGFGMAGAGMRRRKPVVKTSVSYA